MIFQISTRPMSFPENILVRYLSNHLKSAVDNQVKKYFSKTKSQQLALPQFFLVPRELKSAIQ